MSIVMSVNAGSSSLKFQVFEMPSEKVLAKGLVERIGLNDSVFSIKVGDEKFEEISNIPDHSVAVQKLIDALIEHGVVNRLEDIEAVGHRMVHGGEFYSDSVKASDEAEEKFEACIPLAPLHNPAGLVGYRSFKEALPNASHTFVFDTAFHQSMPEENFIYPIPYKFYEEDHIRRYGMHGTSHKYLVERLAEIEGKPVDKMNIITCHLGNGASITAIKDGKSLKTSMGFTPLAGVMMGTRSGDIDPAILIFLQNKYGYTAAELDDILNKQSGMLGLSGISSDSRDIEDGIKAGNERAILTEKVYVNRIIETIGGYFALMGGCDAIVFAGGIGENAIDIREHVCEGIECLGVKFDAAKNNVRGKEALISAPDSKIAVWVIPTNEEVMLARDAYKDLTHGNDQ
ncbi:acetate/propionate family kinase [Dubosiella muris]|uniref:Acetate kinase n=1 Tax=Dubosiella muris TaxID=3038133 RepID=A0AC61R775_9FIRM|nr:acetate kinase [Dubosiella muris]TGY65839.1 acetate kinase [Dubosiella muris]